MFSRLWHLEHDVEMKTVCEKDVRKFPPRTSLKLTNQHVYRFHLMGFVLLFFARVGFHSILSRNSQNNFRSHIYVYIYIYTCKDYVYYKPGSSKGCCMDDKGVPIQHPLVFKQHTLDDADICIYIYILLYLSFFRAFKSSSTGCPQTMPIWAPSVIPARHITGRESFHKNMGAMRSAHSRGYKKP